MQKVVVFEKMSFWTSQPNITELNRKIESLNKDGWRVVSLVPSITIVGRVLIGKLMWVFCFPQLTTTTQLRFEL